MGSYENGCLGCGAIFYNDLATTYKKGRTPEQKKVISYFAPAGGCIGLISSMFTMMKDHEYDAKIQQRVKKLNSMENALNKLGIDIEMVNEVKPIYVEGYYYDDKKVFAKAGKDGKWRSSAYEFAWIFCGDKQLYVYSYRFNMDEDGKKETAQEYFYKDITNISHSTETVEKETYDGSCIRSHKVLRNIDYTRFQLSSMGDKFYCSMYATEENERSVQGLKNKLREKKNA